MWLSQVASVLALGMKPHVRKKMEQNEEKLAENELLEVGDIGLDDDATGVVGQGTGGQAASGTRDAAGDNTRAPMAQPATGAAA